MQSIVNLTTAAVQLDDKALEQIMIQEETKQFQGTLGTVRVVDRPSIGICETKEPTGDLYSRVFSLLQSTWGCQLQTDFRANVYENPAFAPIQHELRQAYRDGTLDAKFDLIESTGAVVTYDKSKNIVTLGINEVEMRSAVRERTQMVDLRHKKLIDHANGVQPDSVFREPKSKPIELPQIGTSFYVSFNL